MSSACDSVVQEVRSGGTAVCQYFLSVKKPSVHVEVVGVASYRLPVGTQQSVQFSYKLSLSNFIR